MKKNTRVFLVVMSTVIMLGLPACGSIAVGREAGNEANIPTTMPVEINQQKLFKMNEEVKTCGVVLMVTEMTRTQNISEGHDLVVISVTLENQSGSQVPINTFDFTLVDNANQTHTDAMAQVEKPLGSPRLVDGNSFSGMVTYRVPAGDTDLKLIWQPGWCTEVVYIDLK